MIGNLFEMALHILQTHGKESWQNPPSDCVGEILRRSCRTIVYWNEIMVVHSAGCFCVITVKDMAHTKLANAGKKITYHYHPDVIWKNNPLDDPWP